MKNLADRLRSIVRQDHGGSSPARRDFTYVPDVFDPAAIAVDPAAAAEALGGQPLESHGGCIVIDRLWDADDWHGRRRVGTFVPNGTAPIGLFDPRTGRVADWAQRVVFFDLETTGLSGGAGTLAFLAGCGWFEGDAFRVRQFFLGSPAGEQAMLAAITEIFDNASLLITFNGRSFDVPLMETRWAFHRSDAASDGLPHFDMLPVSRRLWGQREDAGDAGCRLSELERSILGFHRVGDVPGFEIPARYFHFLRTGDGAAVSGVLEHNRHDLISLAGVTAHALSLATDGPSACRESCEQVALGRMYERAGQPVQALVAYELAVSGSERGEREVRLQALSRLAALLGRLGRHQDAASAWQGVLDHARRFGAPQTVEQRAVQALAIHHEHRARDLAEAHRYAERLSRQASGRARQDAAHRLGRIERKLNGKGENLLS
ncbi:MAG TPA: ribonuclease H-like domain-containing protein [Vicinamibacterales bacterium]|nr:ribonuclease H-like domain-containing protein [Vicinamibacterales bacterium]